MKKNLLRDLLTRRKRYKATVIDVDTDKAYVELTPTKPKRTRKPKGDK